MQQQHQHIFYLILHAKMCEYGWTNVTRNLIWELTPHSKWKWPLLLKWNVCCMATITYFAIIQSSIFAYVIILTLRCNIIFTIYFLSNVKKVWSLFIVFTEQSYYICWWYFFLTIYCLGANRHYRINLVVKHILDPSFYS